MWFISGSDGLTVKEVLGGMNGPLMDNDIIVHRDVLASKSRMDLRLRLRCLGDGDRLLWERE